MTEAQRAETVRLYAEKISPEDIAVEVRMSASTIRRCLQRLGLLARMELVTKLPRSKYREVGRKYSSGRSMADLAREYGVCYSVIRKALLKIDAPIRAAAHIKPTAARDIKKMVSMYTKDNMSQVAISEAFGVCVPVVARALRENGAFIPGRASGARHGMWKGGITLHESGYRLIRLPIDHPFYSMAVAQGYVPEHRLVMAQKLGRPLTNNETVHHKDGDRLNNNLDNLQLRKRHHGNGQCFACADCGSRNIIAAELEGE